MTQGLPRVSVVMPVYNEEAHIEASVSAVLAQDYPPDLIEILVADGGSTDRTRDLLHDIARRHSDRSIRIIDNPGRVPGNGLNQAIRQAVGDVVLRVDGHCVIDPRHISECVRALKESGAENAGGRFVSVGANWFGRAVAVATTSLFGTGGTRFRRSGRHELVDTVPLGAWRIETFDRLGLFLEGIRAAEDAEFNFRIRAGGGTILLLGDLPIRYLARSTPAGLWRQYFTYGRMKALILSRHPAQAQARHQATLGLVVCGATLTLAAIVSPAAARALALAAESYLALLLLVSLGMAAWGGWRLLPALSLALGIVHLAYGVGWLAGLGRLVIGRGLSPGVPWLTRRKSAPLPGASHASPLQSVRELRLAVLEDRILFRRNGDYSCNDVHVLFLRSFRERLRKVTLCARLASGTRQGHYPIVAGDLDVCPLPYYRDLPRFFRRPMRHLRAAHAAIEPELLRSDLLWLAWPHPLSLWLLAFIRRRKLPVIPFMVVRQNLAVQVGHRYPGWRRPAAVLTARFLDAQLARLNPEALVFTIGEEMHHHYRTRFRHVHRMESAKLSLSDLQPRVDGPRGRRPLSRLLYVGRLAKEKGVPHLLRAVALLHAEGRSVHVVLVGEGPEEGTLRRLAAELGIASLVSFRGYIPFGPALFDCYRDADIFVLPSLTEGAPAALREALGFGLPSIATRVGGVPGMIATGDNGWLVEPGSAEALCEGVRRLQDDPALAERLRQRGPQGAEAFTLEAQRDRMLETVAHYVAERAASPAM